MHILGKLDYNVISWLICITCGSFTLGIIPKTESVMVFQQYVLFFSGITIFNSAGHSLCKHILSYISYLKIQQSATSAVFLQPAVVLFISFLVKQIFHEEVVDSIPPVALHSLFLEPGPILQKCSCQYYPIISPTACFSLSFASWLMTAPFSLSCSQRTWCHSWLFYFVHALGSICQ